MSAEWATVLALLGGNLIVGASVVVGFHLVLRYNRRRMHEESKAMIKRSEKIVEETKGLVDRAGRRRRRVEGDEWKYGDDE